MPPLPPHWSHRLRVEPEPEPELDQPPEPGRHWKYCESSGTVRALSVSCARHWDKGGGWGGVVLRA